MAQHDTNASFANNLADHVKLIREANLPIRKVEFINEYVCDVDFSGMDLARAIFQDCIIENCNFENSNIEFANFDSAAITDCKFTGSICDFASFRNAIIKDCDFRSVSFLCSDIRFATIRKSILSNCLFRAADISETAFISCPVDNADFTKVIDANSALFSNVIGAKMPEDFSCIIPQ